MRICVNNRDCAPLLEYFSNLKQLELVVPPPSFSTTQNLLTYLHDNRIEVLVQMAPQWEWGRYMEQVSLAVLSSGKKLFAAEGSLFRWLGNRRRAGTDIGFYLSPWGYSGNSKLSRSLPSPSGADMAVANSLMDRLPRWKSSSRRVLVLGQINGDRAALFRGQAKSNSELITLAQSLWGESYVYFKPHPLSLEEANVVGNTVSSKATLADIVNDFGIVVSANSTGTVEAICCGIPVMCTGVGPWSGSHIVSSLRKEPYSYSRSDATYCIAALASLHHFLPSMGMNPNETLFERALAEHSAFDSELFSWSAIKSDMEPQPWNGQYFWD